MTTIEKTFIRAFALPNKRDRLLGMLDKTQKREKLRLLLPHSELFDPKWICRIPNNRQHAADIFEMINEKLNHEENIIPGCHMISAIRNLDGADMELREALDCIVGSSSGSIVICDPEHLGYFEGEANGDRYILFR